MNVTFNISNWDLNGTSAAHAFQGRQDFTLTTQDLLDVCGAMDDNALLLAVVGLITSLCCLLYIRRFRARVRPDLVVFFDKALLTGIMMLFGGIIVRVMRGG